MESNILFFSPYIIYFWLQFLQVGTNKAKLKQVGKNSILVVEDVKGMTGLHRFLSKAKGFQKK